MQPPHSGLSLAAQEKSQRRASLEHGTSQAALGGDRVCRPLLTPPPGRRGSLSCRLVAAVSWAPSKRREAPSRERARRALVSLAFCKGNHAHSELGAEPTAPPCSPAAIRRCS